MNFRTTFILLLIALMLGTAIFLLKKYVPTTEERERQKDKIVDFSSKEVTSFEIRKKDSAIAARKDTASGWQLTAPVRDKADQNAIEMLLRELDYLKKKDIITETNLAPYGLDRPRLVLTFQAENNQTTVINIGNDAPVGNTLYLQVTNDTHIYLVDKDFYQMFDKTVFDLRDKKIFEVDLYEVNQFRLIYNGQTTELEKKNNDWYLTTPLQEKADSDRPRSFLLDLNNLTVESFVSDNETDFKKYGLDQPVLKITVSETKDNKAKSESLLFGNLLPDDPAKIYCLKENTKVAMTVDSTVFDKLKLKSNDFRSKKLFELEESNLTGIAIQTGQQPLVQLKRENENWKLDCPISGTFHSAAITDFISRLNEFQIYEFTAENTQSLEKYGLLTPALTMTLAFKQPRDEMKVNAGVFPDGAEVVYVAKSGENRVLAFKRDFFDFLKKGCLLFQDKNVLNINRDEVKTFNVEKADGGKFSAKQEKPGNWLVVEPKDAKLEDISPVYEFLDNISQVEAVEFIAGPEADLNEYGLTPPFLKLTLEFGSGEQTQAKTLLVGKETANGARYAKLTDLPFVFILPPSIINSLQKEIIK